MKHRLRLGLALVPVLALAGCVSAPGDGADAGPAVVPVSRDAAALAASERARTDIWVYSDSATMRDKVEAALRQHGYTRVEFSDDANNNLNIKWSRAPGWMVAEVLAVAAAEIGEDPRAFRQLNAPGFEDAIGVNLPTRRLRAQAAGNAPSEMPAAAPAPRPLAGHKNKVRTVGAAPRRNLGKPRPVATVRPPGAAALDPSGPFINHTDR